MGRSLRTDARRDVILQALRAGNTREAAAGYAGISERTFRAWRAADSRFQRVCAEAEATAEVRMATVVADAAFGRPAQHDDMGRVIRSEVRPNPEHAEWWLERRRPHAWGRRITMDIRATIERFAAEQGLDADDLIAEAERLFAEHAEQYR